jgi:hypothetical protein
VTPEPSGRPVDVDTGFWLWVASLPLMVTGYVVDLLTTTGRHLPMPMVAAAIVFVGVVAAVVLTFQILMWHGYRWARTLLTGGGVATVVYAATNLFTAERSTAAALTYAICVISGSVLIAGGIYLLHRKDAHSYFTR